MANKKTGLSYYNIDTDRYMNIKIKRLKKDFGCSGVAVYDYILCEIYRVRGCFLVWDESTAFDVAEYWGLKESLVNEIVNYCGVVGLFDKELLTRGSVSNSTKEMNRCGKMGDESPVSACVGIITSKSIQSRYLEICNRAKRKNAEIPEVCRILPEESPKPPEELTKTPEVCRKVKESKVNKENLSNESQKKRQDLGAASAATLPQSPFPNPKNPAETDCATPTEKTDGGLAVTQEDREKKAARELEKRKKEFYNTLVPFVDRYPKETVRSFFDYWSEKNRSGSKMRFELEKTWEVGRRLATWANREKGFNKLKTADYDAKEAEII
ncbi:MAG: DUF4373 domain-containing protein [Tannerellaceae bacterium]|jgi:hypothetical protein|nr:DUF4373 domain-containing protein [Tannerellaceae bacterium]